MRHRLYLDNCAFNRPYDDQTAMKIRLEAEAKTFIQAGILRGKYELAWSYILDYEISFNPDDERRRQIMKWKKIAAADINFSTDNFAVAVEIMQRHKIKAKDALHLACALAARCDYFITTDGGLLRKSIDGLGVVNPFYFVSEMEV
ncbi:hypothetical protein FACS1894139_13350 [Planctomycetales bacterium]|nr:hypothetical protein FACS1894107_09620 [Planctomycetales bacterium]GHT01863.1 hypothetical protein FACS1894108_15860 [Planctomycetales bacterium]GHT06757.1 hypothetical protein FACS1894139_13350 [Planctomycetales bacterium]